MKLMTELCFQTNICSLKQLTIQNQQHQSEFYYEVIHFISKVLGKKMSA